MGLGELFEKPAAFGRDLDEDFSPIKLARALYHKPVFDRAIDELDSAVVLNLEPLGETADRRPKVILQPPNGEQQLVLLRLESHFASARLAEGEKSTDAVPNFRKGGVVSIRDS